ncbi:MAG: Tim44 domain-containing protein [Syntrophobacteraceae bacterium]
MRKLKGGVTGLVLAVLFVFGTAILTESYAWARAGGGRSMGSRGSRSFSTPQGPSGPSQGSPGFNTPGRGSVPGSPAQAPGGFFSRSPFMQGLMGGLAGGMIGSLLFGGLGHASSGSAGGGGIGFLDLAIVGLLLYLVYRIFRRRREQNELAGAQYAGAGASVPGGQPGFPDAGYSYPAPDAIEPSAGYRDLDRGIGQIRQFDPDFSEEGFRETAQDLFFRVQAGWTNRSMQGIQDIVAEELASNFREEFDQMNRKGLINRLENIAVRKVELTEAWQEMGKEFVTVLITANLLDYTVDEGTGEVVAGDKSSPVKFQEFWTFRRDVGSSLWQLSAIDQAK